MDAAQRASSANHEALPVTVVIPAYNRPAMVQRAVRSALRQEPRRPAEVIVVDDCSRDDTGQAAAAAGATVIRHEVNRGEGAARNTGIEHATQPWIALLDSDDEWLPHLLATLWPLRDGHILVGGASLAREYGVDEVVYGGALGRGPLILLTPRPLIYPENFIAASGTMVRRNALTEVGGYAPLQRGADLDLWIRVLERGSGVIAPRPVVIYHRHSEQITGDAQLMAAAHRSVAFAYDQRWWWDPTFIARWEGAARYDAARRQWRRGNRVGAVRRLTSLARSRHHLSGAVGIVVRRARLKRRSGGYSVTGFTTITFLPRTAVPAGLDGVRDLTGLSFPRATLELIRRPSRRAVAASSLQAAAVRLLGVRTVTISRISGAKREGADHG